MHRTCVFDKQIVMTTLFVIQYTAVSTQCNTVYNAHCTSEHMRHVYHCFCVCVLSALIITFCVEAHRNMFR